SSKAKSLRRATSCSPRSMCRRMSNASLLLAPSCSFRSGGNAWHTVSNAAPIIFSASGSYTYLTSLNEGISSSLFAPMQARPALPLRAGRKRRRSLPLHFRKFVKIVSPAAPSEPSSRDGTAELTASHKPHIPQLVTTIVLIAAAFLGGALNSLAGGGTLVTFPALLFAGLNPIDANASSVVALFSGTFAGAWAYRRNILAVAEFSVLGLFVLSLVGGLIGALLLLWTPTTIFASLVPWLILFATIVFAVGNF